MNRVLLMIAVAVLSATAIMARNVTVVPYPDDVVISDGTFNAAGAGFRYDAGFDKLAKDAVLNFAAQLSAVSGKQSNVRKGNSDKGFVFVLDKELPAEAYRLIVDADKALVEASSLNGVIYAIQTIKQLLPVQIYGKELAAEQDWTIPCVKINDAPRFGYRGMMLDVARHFFTVDQVKKCLDLMEIHKLNTFHWHLTDDQGWRIEIKKYPRLTQIGSVRKETLIGHYRDNKGYDGTPYGEGMWYTQDQIREVVAYAASKGITVIPEIDLPGHMVGALSAYPELGCTGGPYEVRTKWGIADEALCAGKETTYEFLENVLSEVCDLFPGEYVHIGGDECRKGCWEKCPHCQAKIRELGYKDDDRHTAEQYLQSYVTRRMENFLNSKGKRLIGWEEILEGNLTPSATVMSWRGKKAEIEAVRKGHDVIMAPKTHCYLDYYQTKDKDNEPLAIGGYLPVEVSYALEPTAGLDEQQAAHILGVQANLWTEYIGDEDYLFYMLLPRLTALTEVQWCRKENKDWNRFVLSIEHIFEIYDILDYDYGKHILRFCSLDIAQGMDRSACDNR
ncbi:MAG: beta-N-acetylhexosaminidase [Bacteroidales bacterium]|nr:beta-N-acetylhexosaminidase [Bacteroidales bacterium]